MIESEKWYAVKELAAETGWSNDTIRRLVYRGRLRGVQLPVTNGGRKRIFRSIRIQGKEWLRFVERNVVAIKLAISRRRKKAA